MAGSTTHGWCENDAHSRFDHRIKDDCVNSVTDAEWTERLMKEAAVHDTHVEYSSEAAYVAAHRPY